MNNDTIAQIIGYTIPSLVTAGVAFYFLKMFLANEENRRRFLMMKANRKNALPLRLQAYERMTLFLERINLSKIIIRISPISPEKKDYANLLIQHIEQEFEHNLTQQIYMTEDTWNVILTAKNTTIQMIRKISLNPEVTDANKLRESILNELLQKQPPTQMAIDILKKEVTRLW